VTCCSVRSFFTSFLQLIPYFVFFRPFTTELTTVRTSDVSYGFFRILAQPLALAPMRFFEILGPRYLGQLGQVFGPCPWPPAPVRRGICHQILEVFVTKFSKSIAFDLCSKNSDIAVSNASCLFIHSENFRGSNTSKLLRTFVSSSL